MSFRSQVASNLRRFIFAKQYHSISSATAVTRRTRPAFLPSPVGLYFNRSLHTEDDVRNDSSFAETEKQMRLDREYRRQERIKAGLDTADIDAEEEKENEDWLGVEPLLEKLEKEEEDRKNSNQNQSRRKQNRLRLELELDSNEIDSDSEDDEDDELEDEDNYEDQMEGKVVAYEDLLDKFFKESDDFGVAFKLMNKIERFEKKFLAVRPEYRVIGELMKRLKETTDIKEKFLLQHKINRGLRVVELREKFDPENPANYGLINAEKASESSGDRGEKKPFKNKGGGQKGHEKVADEDDSDDEVENFGFDAEKEKDDIVLEQIAALDKQLEEKLATLDHTFGKKGKLLEAEIRDLAEARSALTRKRIRPQYRIGFDTYPISLNRTCKVTKGGQVRSFTAIVACGNYNGIVGFAKAKGKTGPTAYAKAYEKCFQNLHTIERHEEHTIAHAVQAEYKKTKVYLWPARTQTGMKAGKTVETILNLAGFKNIKSKIVGSRNPHNTMKALFKALNAIETPKDVQEKYGRTVVESYLL